MILVEVSLLGETMWMLYEGFSSVHKEVFHFHGLQQERKDFIKTLENMQVSISYVQEGTMWYKGASLNLVKKMKP